MFPGALSFLFFPFIRLHVCRDYGVSFTCVTDLLFLPKIVPRERDAAKMRDSGPTLFTSVRHNEGVKDVIEAILGAWRASGADKRRP